MTSFSSNQTTFFEYSLAEKQVIHLEFRLLCVNVISVTVVNEDKKALKWTPCVTNTTQLQNSSEMYKPV